MRRMTPSEYANYLRQQQNKYNQAVRQYNQEVDRVNRANKAARERAISEHNREVDRVNRHNARVVADYNRDVDRVNRHNRQVADSNNRAVAQRNREAAAAITRYNQSVRAYNSALERDRQQRVSQLRSSSAPRYVEVRRSTIDLSDQYEHLRNETGAGTYDDLVAMSGREADNSAVLAEALIADEPTAPPQAEPAQDSVLDCLAGFSQDLRDRWAGALFALDPANPDAGRQFCTSVREIFSTMLERSASDEEVIAADPGCDRAPDRSSPSRRSKLRYLLRRKGADTPRMVGFVEKDIDDVLQLFRVFNEATHGEAGRHGFAKLQAIRRRVEGGIMFLAAVAV